MSRPKPFAARSDAAYWGGGVIAAATGGGYYSLHAVSHPGGVDTYHVGLDHRTERPSRAAGWPARDQLVAAYVYARPDDGGAPCVCVLKTSEVRE